MAERPRRYARSALEELAARPDSGQMYDRFVELLAAHGDVLEGTFGPGLQVLRDKYAPLT